MTTNSKLDLPYLVPDHQAIRERSALTAILAILRTEGLEPIHQRELLSVGLWKLTEAGANPASDKRRIRLRSAAAIDQSKPVQVHHEHVYERKWLIAELNAMNSSGVGDNVIESFLREHAVACTVTTDEHKMLASVEGQGWERYAAAGIVVMDMLTGRPFALPDLPRKEPMPPVSSWIEGLSPGAAQAAASISDKAEALGAMLIVPSKGANADYIRIHDALAEEPSAAVAYLHRGGALHLRLPYRDATLIAPNRSSISQLADSEFQTSVSTVGEELDVALLLLDITLASGRR